jgi:3-oxoacyl-[acyl-carrier protein] reductase
MKTGAAGGRVDGKIAVVTGAAHGLGRAVALRLAGEGADIVMGDIDGEQLAQTGEDIRALGNSALELVGDLGEEKVAQDLIAAAIDTYGRIDILVNNLGGSRNAPIWEMSAADWDYTIRLNLRSLFLCTRFAVPHMMAERQGRIICFSSGAREGTPWLAYYGGGSAYSAAKAAVHGFIRDVAMELAEYDITVNAVAPGPIDTDRVGPGLRKLDETAELGPSRLTPLGRLGLPVEVANAVLFLASDEASYISGHTLAVAGGR